MNLKSTNKVETNKYELELEVTAEEFNQAIDHVYKQESKKMNIPGFRKGKAPKAFVEKYYGSEVFFEAAIDHLYRPMVTEAIEKSELEVIALGDFKIDAVSKENGLQAKITVVVKPEAKIEGYKGIEVAKEPVVVSAGDVDSEIERVRERNSRIVDIDDRATQNGDITVIDFDGYVDGKQFDGGKAENFELTLGAGQFIPGFEEQVEGHTVGEEFDVNVKFPEDYHAEELKGKDATFKIKLHAIKVKELPEVDDEFVKDVSEFDTVDEYRADLEKSLLEKREQAADSDVENQLIDKIIEKVEAEIPEEMIENEVDDTINGFAYRLQSQGLSLETYLKYTGMSTDDLRGQYRLQAERQVKVRLGLEKIAELEKISATEEELTEEYEKLAKAYEMPVENIKNMVNPTVVTADIANRKVIDFIRENAVITEAKKDDEPVAEKKPAPKKKAAPKKVAATDDEAPAKPKRRTTKKTDSQESEG